MGEISLSSPNEAAVGAGVCPRGFGPARTRGGPDQNWSWHLESLKQLGIGGSGLGGLGYLAGGTTQVAMGAPRVVKAGSTRGLAGATCRPGYAGMRRESHGSAAHVPRSAGSAC